MDPTKKEATRLDLWFGITYDVTDELHSSGADPNRARTLDLGYMRPIY